MVLDLLKKMLDKNPRTRIAGSQALKHEVFEHQMDIEDESPLVEKKNMLIKCLEKNKILCRSSLTKENEMEGKNQFQKKKFTSFNMNVGSDPLKSKTPFQRLL